MPEFAHLPLILKPEGNGKLSKRDGDRLGFPVFPIEWENPENDEISSGYRESGYTPEAFINMLAFLGWNPGTSKEIFSMDELINEFSLKRVGKSGAKFDFDKTRWYNQQYLRAKKNDMLAEELQVILKAQNINVENSFVAKVCNELKERATFVSDMWEEGKYFFASPKEYDKKTLRKKWKDNIPEMLLDLKERLGRIDDFKSEKIEQDFKEVLLKNNIGMGQLLPAFRLALTGIAMGPSLFNIAEIIGKEKQFKE